MQVNNIVKALKRDQEKLSLGLRSLNLPADRPEKKAKARKSPVETCFQDVVGSMIPDDDDDDGDAVVDDDDKDDGG